MIKSIDWQMVAFVSASLLQEYAPHFHIPKMYYWDIRKKRTADDDKVA
jgi:hypothetical protein